MSEPHTINKTQERPGGGTSGGLMLLVFLALVAIVLFTVPLVDDNRAFAEKLCAAGTMSGAKA